MHLNLSRAQAFLDRYQERKKEVGRLEVGRLIRYERERKGRNLPKVAKKKMG